MAILFDRDRVGWDTATNATADTTNWDIDLPTDSGTTNIEYYHIPFNYIADDKKWYFPPKKMAIVGEESSCCEYCLKDPCKSNCEAEVKGFNL